MSWKSEVDGIEQRRRLAKQLGGTDAVEQQHARGRLTVRERIDALLDRDSFYEQGAVAGHPVHDEQSGALTGFAPANYVLGMGRIGGRPCVVGGEDYTQRGGSPSPAGLRKSVYAEELACRYRVPLVRFLQGGGGSIAGTAGKQEPSSGGDPVYSPHRFQSIARVMATAPVVSAALGAVAGLPAARLAASHFALMTRRTSQVLIAGPAIVERALGEVKNAGELGGAQVHESSGVVDNVVEDEAEAFTQIRRFLSYLPTNIDALPPCHAGDDPRERREEELLSIVPRDRRQAYDMRRLIAHVVDRDSLFELTPGYGRSQITALARLDGRPIGVWANDPQHFAGALTADGARKVRRFVDLCDAFHLPVVAFVDEPGFMIGSAAERAGTIRFGVEAIFSVVQSQVPWASILVRRRYGVAGGAHFGPEAYVLAWPSAETGAVPVEGGIAVAFRREIAASDNPTARRLELEERFAAARSPFPRAESFSVHDLIDPRETRPALCEWIDWAWPLLSGQLGERPHTIRP